MHYIIEYNRAKGTVISLKEHSDNEWSTAFKDHQKKIADNTNDDISISLVDAKNLADLKKHYGAFFHKKDM